MSTTADNNILPRKSEESSFVLITDRKNANVKSPEKRRVIPPSFNATDGLRNRRMLANIQAALGSGSDEVKTRKIKPQLKVDNLVFLNLSEALEKIRLADTDVQVSLSDIRPYLLANEKILKKDELKILCTTFCTSALLQSNLYYIVGLCVDLINNHDFLNEMSDHLKDTVAKFLDSDDTSNIGAVPEFLAQLAVAKWPRGRNKAIKNLNPILYTVISTVMGWINFILEFAEKENEEIDKFKLNLVVKCAEAMCTFCMIGQRSLWLNFPEIFDSVYEASKSLLITDLRLKKSVKLSMLNLYLLLNKWSANNTRKYLSVATQTVFKI